MALTHATALDSTEEHCCLDMKHQDEEGQGRLGPGLLDCRCPGTKGALQALSSRRVNDAFTLFESLMRAAVEDEMQVEGVQDAAEGQVNQGPQC